MPQRGGRVPQFGKWEDGPNPAYTMIFENARKDKNGEPKLANLNDPEAAAAPAAAPAKVDRPPAPAPAPAAARAPRFIINPNDPEQNPRAFRAAGAAEFAQEYRHFKQDYGDRTPPREAAYRPQPAKVAAAGYGMQQQPYRSGRNNNSARSSSSDYPDGSRLGQRQGTAGRRPPEPAAGAAYGHATPSPLRQQGTPGRRAAVPRFGGWDETDPATSEGYTMVFKKVKEERQNAQAFPASLLSDEPETFHARPSGYKPRRSFWSKLCCCFSPSVH